MLHRRVAQALEALHAEDLDSVSGQIASHYERAGMIEQALPYYQRAAAVAQCVYANEDAISLLSRSLKSLELLPAGAKRDKQELSLQLALAPLYRVTKGWATPELERVLDRALALCDTVGDEAQRAQTLYGLQSVYVVQDKLERVQMVSDELHTLYQRSLGTVPPPFAGMMLAGARLHLGRITEGNAQFAEIIAAHDPDQILYFQESQGSNYAALARRGKHTRSGAWAIRSRHSIEGSTRSSWCRIWISLSTRRWCQPTWPCCSSCAPMRPSPESTPSKCTRSRASTRHPTITRGQASWSAMRWPWSNPIMRSASSVCVARSPNLKHRVPDCVCRITSRCSRRSMGKPGVWRRGSHASTRRWQKRAHTTSAGGTRSYIGYEASCCSCMVRTPLMSKRRSSARSRSRAPSRPNRWNSVRR